MADPHLSRRAARRAARAALSLSTLAALLLQFAAAGCGPKDAAQEAAATARGDAAGTTDRKDAATLVRVGTVRCGAIESAIEVSTDIEAEKRVSVYPKVGPAHIARLDVDEGDPVQAGDPLLHLDDVDFRIALRRAESELLQAKMTVEQRRVQLAESGARQRAQEAVANRAKADFERAKSAMSGEIDVLSAKELKDAEAAWLQGLAELEAARLTAERGQSDLELARLEVEAAEIELESARKDLDDTVVRSPIDGVVQERLVNAGLLVNSANQLFTIVDPNLLVANLRVPQEDLRSITGPGLPVEFALDALPGQLFRGAIEALNPAVDPGSGLVKIRARLDQEARGRVLPGMFSRARIIVARRDDAAMLNKRAVVYDQGRTYFFAVVEGRARRHAFAAGASTEDEIEVLQVDGGPLLRESAEARAGVLALKIVLVGQDRLRDGDPVSVVEGSS